jgi:O-antigen ligase
VYNRYAGDAPMFEGFGRGSHNIYLKIVVEAGLVGFLFFLLAINSQRNLVAECRRYSSNGPPPLLVASEAAFWAVLVFSFFGDPLYDKSFWLAWIMLTFATKLAGESAEPSLQPARS